MADGSVGLVVDIAALLESRVANGRPAPLQTAHRVA
jgi:hypothetical protein